MGRILLFVVLSFVMAGLDPAIHALFAPRSRKIVDARDEPGHDGC
jgi:hypothetical protein